MANEDSTHSGVLPISVAKDQIPKFPIVGIGASAGGLEAFKLLFQALPPDLGMAFVLIPHLDPEHSSLMPEILTRMTSMPVTQVTDELQIERNHVYVIPPNRTMLLVNGHLKLMPREGLRGQPRSIDVFLRSLAEDQKHQSIAIILSGTGSDGTLGVEAVKAEGGITFAQDDSAQQNSMPRSAAAAGCIDFVLAPEGIAAELARIARHPYLGVGDSPRQQIISEESLAESDLNKILQLLHDTTGVDFIRYKSVTFLRRITRRMVLHRIEDLAGYFRKLEIDADELQSLYRDLLISVTAFFRDASCFDTIKQKLLPEVFRGRSRSEPVRVWVLGCSSGEEAYSLAITISEFTAEQGIKVPVQIFATDLNEHSIMKARLGLYSKNIVQDVSAERLSRFFVETESHYQVVKEIRELCVFARQNVLADPPFSHLDLMSCRNLLIYLKPAFQKHLISLAHYSLRPGGYLWLGNSESIIGFDDLFETVEPRQKIFKRKPGTPPPVAFVAPAFESRDFVQRRPPRLESNVDTQREADRLAVTKYAPPGVLLNTELEVQQFRGDTSPYLAQAAGKPTTSILKMAREGLLVPLRSALDKVRTEGTSVRQEGVHIRFDTGIRIVNLEVLPLGHSGPERGFLVFFEDSERQYLPNVTRVPPSDDLNTDEEVTRLTQELDATREYMQSLVEQQESSNEELQSANEEIQSFNEELQSINEELQTSKEEIQSSNEELTTVNDELRNRNEQLDRALNDLNNFIASSQLPIVMVGADLRIRRFSPTAEQLLNLIHADIGRLIGELRFPFDLQNLDGLLAESIHDERSSEREVQNRRGHWYSLRIHPYRTSSNVIDGAVIYLVSIDAQKQALEEIRIAEEKYRLLVEGATGVAIMLLNREGNVAGWNVGAERIFGYSAAEITGTHFSQFFVPEDVASGKPLRELELARKEMIVADDRWLVRRDTTRFWATGVTNVLYDATGAIRGFSKVVRDITEKKHEESLLENDRRKDEFLAILAHELRNPLATLANTLEALRHSDRDSATIDRGLGMVERQVGKLKHLVGDILDVARINGGHLELRRETIDLRLAVAQAIEIEQNGITAAHLNLSIDLPSEPVWIKGDALRLEQIFANVLDNAVKYNNPGGQIELTLKISDAASNRAGSEAIVRVQDTGVGIQPEQLAKVFEFFARGDVSDARRTGGLGVGLSLVKNLVELHFGTIEVYSAGSGKGSAFTIHLPLALDTEALEPKSDAPPSISESRTPSAPRRILIIDDNSDAADALGELLRLFGHDVEIALSGPDGLRSAAAFSPEVVFVDIAMPDMDGYEVAQQLRRQTGPQTKVVALSGYSSDEHRRRSLEAGFDTHLVKPIDVDLLTNILGHQN
ncbi:MAG: CheR family methyltransferase [Candidatus Binataceae bacterium]